MNGSSNGHPRDLLSAHLDGELGAADQAAVDAHLAGCSECREHLLSLRALAKALHGEDVPAVPLDLETRIGRRIDAQTVVPVRRRFAIPATIAATIAAVGLLSMVVLEQRSRPESPAAPHRTIATPPVLRNENAPQPSESKDQKKMAAAPAPRHRDVELQKEKTAPAPPPMPPTAQPTQAPSDALSGGAQPQSTPTDESAAQRQRSFGYAAAPTPEAKTEAALSSAVRRPAGDPCAMGIADSPVEAQWLVRDTDEATRQIALAAVGSEGRMLPSEPDTPLSLVTVVPAKNYPAFVVRLRAMDVLGLDDVRRVETAGCVRQRIVLRRVAVN